MEKDCFSTVMEELRKVSQSISKNNTFEPLLKSSSETSFQSSCNMGNTPIASAIAFFETSSVFSLRYPHTVMESLTSSEQFGARESFNSDPLGLGDLRYGPRGGRWVADDCIESVKDLVSLNACKVERSD